MAVKRRVFLPIFIVISTSTLAFLYFYVSSPFPKGFSPGENIYLICKKIEDRSEQYSCYKEVALSAMENGASVKDLFHFISEPHNHLQEHSVGRAALIVSGYDLYVTKEMCGQDCSSGYYHALAQEWGEYAPSRLGEFEDFLNSFCPIKGVAERTGCYHNVGHFYMGANKNFEASMARCDKLETYERFSKCSYGVIHEQFIQFGTQNFFALCSAFTGRKNEMCYIRGSLLYPQWHRKQLGVGDNPLEICHELHVKIPMQFNHCYASAAWILHNQGETLNTAWCKNLDENLKELCENDLQSPEPFWGDSPSCGGGIPESEAFECGL